MRPSSYLRCKAGTGLLAACNAASVPTMAADGRRHVIAIGGGMRVPDGRIPVHMDYAGAIVTVREAAQQLSRFVENAYAAN